MPAEIASSRVDFPEYPPPVMTVTPRRTPIPRTPQTSTSSSGAERNGTAPGRPTLFRTTNNFLRVFGLSSLNELPELPQKGEADEEQLRIQETISSLEGGAGDVSEPGQGLDGE